MTTINLDAPYYDEAGKFPSPREMAASIAARAPAGAKDRCNDVIRKAKGSYRDYWVVVRDLLPVLQ